MTKSDDWVQRQCDHTLEFVIAYREQHGMGPSLREIVEGLYEDWADGSEPTKNLIRMFLELLRHQGRLDWEDDKFRSMRPL